MNLKPLRFITLPALAALLAWPAVAQAPVADQQIQAEIDHALNNKRFSGVQAQVQNGVITLNGAVDRYITKMDADNKAHHLKDALDVHDNIQVAVPEGITDAALFAKLGKGLVYDRVGYGTTMFNSLTLQVQNGVATVGGVVYGPPDKDSAIALIANTPGVRGIVDNIQVAPVSPMDDRIRQAEARAIYGYPSLNRYAIDPAKSIRIVVVNGHVTLSGMVDTEADKNVAGIRANGVAGVFSVANDLQVQGQTTERP